MRDYELILYNAIGPAEPGLYSYLFKYCVEAHTVTSLTPESYRRSLDKRLIDWDRAYEDDSLDGYVWGTNCSTLYQWALIPESEKARWWREQIGLDFHEVVIESNGYTINLIFSELVVTKLPERLSKRDVAHHPWTPVPKRKV
jgi:hypothetical protein